MKRDDPAHEARVVIRESERTIKQLYHELEARLARVEKIIGGRPPLLILPTTKHPTQEE
jgi:hypothetical protein